MVCGVSFILRWFSNTWDLEKNLSTSSSPLLSSAVVGEGWSPAILSLCNDMVFKSACDDGSLVSICDWETVGQFSPVSNSGGLFLVCCEISPVKSWCHCGGSLQNPSCGSIVINRDVKDKSRFGVLLEHAPH